MGGIIMLNYIAIILGLLSWGTLFYAIVKRECLTREKLSKLRLQAWILCAISIYTPSIILSAWVKEENITNLLDCTFGYHFGASVLLGVTVMLTIVSVILCRKNKGEK